MAAHDLIREVWDRISKTERAAYYGSGELTTCNAVCLSAALNQYHADALRVGIDTQTADRLLFEAMDRFPDNFALACASARDHFALACIGSTSQEMAAP